MSPSTRAPQETRTIGRILARVLLICLSLSRSGMALASGGISSPAPDLMAAAAWTRVLDRFVSEGGVDYGSLAADRTDLDTYLESIARSDIDALAPSEAIAFWINAYNAVVLRSVLEHYPDLDSVMDVDGFFDERTAVVAGGELTLDEIEAEALSNGDPRVHFAVVCAARSCPPLRRRPYSGEDLEAQLDEQTRGFLGDAQRGARVDVEERVLWLSALFKWYGSDFTGTSKIAAYVDRGRLIEWIEPFVPRELAATINEIQPAVRFLDYDWSLNESRPR